jgi:uncharacterized protein YcbX
MTAYDVVVVGGGNAGLVAAISARHIADSVLLLERAPAWSELGWIGSDIALGGARLRVIAAITRCAATQVNPASALRDLDIVGALQRGFGHNLMGVYAEVVAGGDVQVFGSVDGGKVVSEAGAAPARNRARRRPR